MTKNQTESADLEKRKELQKKIGITVLLISAPFIVSYFNGIGEPSTSYDKSTETTRSNSEIYVEAMAIIRQTLKSPSTAEFPSSYDAQIEQIHENTYKVTSYVDAQNSFGAMLRSDWSVTFEYFEGMIKVWKIELDGEQIFKRPAETN